MQLDKDIYRDSKLLPGMILNELLVGQGVCTHTKKDIGCGV